MMRMLILGISLIWSFCGFTQTNTPDCSSVRTGTFMLFPPVGGDHYVIERSDSVQYEIGVINQTKSWWRINWIDDCSFGLSLIKTSRELSDKEKELWNAHQIVVRIHEVARDYYIFSSGLDSINSKRISLTDTCWRKNRVL